MAKKTYKKIDIERTLLQSRLRRITAFNTLYKRLNERNQELWDAYWTFANTPNRISMTHQRRLEDFAAYYNAGQPEESLRISAVSITRHATRHQWVSMFALKLSLTHGLDDRARQSAVDGLLKKNRSIPTPADAIGLLDSLQNSVSLALKNIMANIDAATWKQATIKDINVLIRVSLEIEDQRSRRVEQMERGYQTARKILSGKSPQGKATDINHTKEDVIENLYMDAAVDEKALLSTAMLKATNAIETVN